MRKKPFTVIGAVGTQTINTSALNSIELAPSEENLLLAVEVGTENIAPNASRRLRRMMKETIAAAKKGRAFHSGRRVGSRSKATEHIYALALAYPALEAKLLYVQADKKILGEMSISTFANHVSAARNKK